MPIPSLVRNWLLDRVTKIVGDAPIRVVLKDGTGLSTQGLSPAATVIVNDRSTLAALALDPEVAFGEAYADGRIEVHGDLVRLLESAYESFARTPKSWYSRLATTWMNLCQNNTLTRSRANVHHHYDLGDDFYKLWLDRQLLYTCAYFPSGAASLEEAQIAKMDYVCRKIKLQAGEAVVEAGCGWGALALHMARHRGVSVKAFNVSREQILYARRRAREEGLDGRVEFIEDDYRNIRGKFDAFVSVGMLEHVGWKHYREFGAVIERCIGDSGRGFVHFIGRSYQAGLSRWIRKRIFPGGYCPTLREAMEVFEPWRFTILDLENLAMHYARTLEHWLERFEKSQQQIEEMYDARFVRMWRLYLAGSLAAFRAGTLQLYQIVFAGPRARPIHWTRAPLYAPRPLEIGKESREPWIPAMS